MDFICLMSLAMVLCVYYKLKSGPCVAAEDVRPVELVLNPWGNPDMYEDEDAFMEVPYELGLC